MGRIKAELEAKERTLLKNNTGTLMVSLPIGEVRKLGWRVGQKVAIKRQGRGFIIQSKP